MKLRLIFQLAVYVCFGITPALAGGHGKTGLWDSKSVTTQNGERGAVTMTICRTKAVAERPETMLQLGDSCKLQNAHWQGEDFEADLVCKGEMSGSGKVQFHFLSPEHYTAFSSFKGTQDGTKLDVATTVDAKFLSNDCGDVKQ